MNTESTRYSDPRERAQTRAVLMALARKRDWYFEASLLSTGLWCLLTLGAGPLVTLSRRFDRFRRLEWNQYHAFAQWLSRTTHDPIASELETFAEKAAGKPASRFLFNLCVIGALCVAAVVLLRTQDLRLLAKTVFVPQSLLWSAIAYSAILAVGWFAHLMTVLRQQTMTSLWIGRFNELLSLHDKRPVPLVVARPHWSMLAAACVLGIVGTPWAAAALLAVTIQNRYTGGTRAVRLAMVERMLEWMDTSGLPVEFDIEEIAPEELVAMS